MHATNSTVIGYPLLEIQSKKERKEYEDQVNTFHLTEEENIRNSQGNEHNTIALQQELLLI